MKLVFTPNKAVSLLTALTILFFCAISAVGQVGILQNFDGAGATGWAPPDPNAAVGPNHIVQAVNNNILIFSKNGTYITGQPLDAFFNAATGGDPHVVYDEISKQFLFEVIWKDGNGNMIGVCFAASDTSDPTGNWHKMFISVPGFWDGYGGNAIGYNADAYVVHVNGFNNQFAVIPINGNPSFSYLMYTAPAGIRIGRPLSMPGSAAGGPFYFLEGNDDGVNGQGGTVGNLEVVRVNGIASGSPTFNDYQVHVNNTGTSMVYASWRNNQLAAIGKGGSSVPWYLLSTSGNPALLQAGAISPPDGGSTDVPSIAVDPNGDLGVNYASITGSGMTMYVTGRGALDSANTMRASVAAAAAPKSAGRIGDYSSCVVDINTGGVPQNTFFACGEYMTDSTSEFDWKTRISKFSIAGSPPAQGVYYIGSYGVGGKSLQGTLDSYLNGSGQYVGGCNEVALTPFNSNTYQQWSILPIGGGQYHIMNTASGQLLQSTGDPYHPHGGGNVGGCNKVALTPNTWNLSQQVWLLPAAGAGYALANPANSQYLQATLDGYWSNTSQSYASGCNQMACTPYSWGAGTYDQWNLVWIRN